jgi:uncharacterized protein (TIGR00369 family)
MSDASDPADWLRDKATAIERFQEVFCGFVPHNRALGLRILDVGGGTVEILLPYAAHLVGDPESGVIHGGAITSLMDATCGASVFLKILKPIAVATLDLRIDYMRPAEAGRDVLAYAHCYHITRNVAFVRGFAFHDDRERPIASAAGTFMLGTAGQSLLPDEAHSGAGEGGRGKEGRQ